jgi:hypothetical protein
VPVGVTPLLGEVLLTFERLGWGNHFPVATGVLLKRRSYASLSGHELVPFCVKQETTMGWMYTVRN